jgi:hypothetical protein
MAMAPSFAATIKPYFTAYFRAHMLTLYTPPLDLWDITQVGTDQNWNKIYNAVSGGSMPPPVANGYPGVWDSYTQTQFLADFQAWKNANPPYPP